MLFRLDVKGLMSKKIPPNRQQQFIDICSHKRNYGKAMFSCAQLKTALLMHICELDILA